MSNSFPSTYTVPIIDCYANNPIVGEDEGGPKALRNAAMYLYENCWSNYICWCGETAFNNTVINIPFRQKKIEGKATNHVLTLALYITSTSVRDTIYGLCDSDYFEKGTGDASGNLFRWSVDFTGSADTGNDGISMLALAIPENTDCYGIHLYQKETRQSSSAGQFENGAWPLDNAAYSYLRPMTPSRYYEAAQLIKTIYSKQACGQFLNALELTTYANYLFAVPLPQTRQVGNLKAHFYLRSKSATSTCTITHKQSGESITLSATGTGATDSGYIEVLSVLEGTLEPQFDEFSVSVGAERCTLVGYWGEL